MVIMKATFNQCGWLSEFFMKKIELSQQGKNKGKFFALVDDEDFEELDKYQWMALRRRKDVYYAERLAHASDNTAKIRVTMHGLLMNTPAGLCCDHKDGNGLNNQKSNLRICTNSENVRNQRLSILNRVGYKGVRASGKRYRARIAYNGEEINLGGFTDIKEAARAYDEAARRLHGAFARTNFE